MTDLTLSVTWSVSSRLHIGSGLSRAGYADRCLQLDSNRRIRYWGEGAKGAVRQSAEALLRWLVPARIPGQPYVPDEADGLSTPPPGVLARLFAPDEYGKFWRFSQPRAAGGFATTYSSTAIDPATRVALTNTLRTRESWDGGVSFSFCVTGFQLDLTPHSPDFLDALFLTAAIAATEQIGGARGTGFGVVAIHKLQPSDPGIDPLLLADPVVLHRLQAHAAAGLPLLKAS